MTTPRYRADCMFYWLIELSNTVPGFGAFHSILNVFRYITFRTGGAIATGALFVFLFGPWIIDHLRLRQGMGGLMILSGLVGSTGFWANPLHPFLWILLAVPLALCLPGFLFAFLLLP